MICSSSSTPLLLRVLDLGAGFHLPTGQRPFRARARSRRRSAGCPSSTARKRTSLPVVFFLTVRVGHLLCGCGRRGSRRCRAPAGRPGSRRSRRTAARPRTTRCRPGPSGREEDDVTAERAERYVLLRLLDKSREQHLAGDVVLVPDGDAGVGEAEDADLDVGRAGDPDALDGVRLEGGGRRVERVRGKEREMALALELAEDLDAVVELVVAEGGGVVAWGSWRRPWVLRALAGDRVHARVVVRQ